MVSFSGQCLACQVSENPPEISGPTSLQDPGNLCDKGQRESARDQSREFPAQSQSVKEWRGYFPWDSLRKNFSPKALSAEAIFPAARGSRRFLLALKSVRDALHQKQAPKVEGEDRLEPCIAAASEGSPCICAGFVAAAINFKSQFRAGMPPHCVAK